MQISKNSIKDKKILIFGLNGTGKTYLAKFLSRMFKCFVITPYPHEWNDTEHLVFYVKEIKEYALGLATFMKVLNKFNFECLIIDDFDLFFKHHLDSNAIFQRILIQNRHLRNEKGICVICITRRPQNIPTKYFEVFDILVAFATESPNVIEKLNQIRSGFGDLVKNLTIESHEFYWKEIGKDPIRLKV